MLKKILFVVSFFFICSSSVFALSDLNGSLYTSNQYRDSLYQDSINLFEESSNRTGFVNMIYNNGFNLGPYFNNIFGLSDSLLSNGSNQYNISIMSIGDLNFLSSMTEVEHTNTVFNSNEFDEIYEYFFSNTSSHSIHYLENYDYIDVDRIIFLTPYGFGNYVEINKNDSHCLYFYLKPKYAFLFDVAGNPVGYMQFDDYMSSAGNTFYFDFVFPFKNVDHFFNDTRPDITSWYSYLFKYVGPIGNNQDFIGYNKIFPVNFHLDNSSYVNVSNNAGYESVARFFMNIGLSYHDFSNFNFNFIYDKVFYSSDSFFNTLYDNWFTSDSVSVPNNYSSFDVSNYSNGYYLVPIVSNNCNDYTLYYSSPSSVISNKLYFNYYKFSDNDLSIYKQFYVFSSSNYSPYSYSPLVDLGIEVSDFGDYAIQIYQPNNTYGYTLYYNSFCYNTYNPKNSNTLAFSSGNYSYSASDALTNFHKYTVNGNDFSSTIQNSSASSNSSVTNVVLDSNGNITLSSALSNVTNWVTGIFDSVYALVGIAGIFLTGLPDIILGPLLSVFVLGLVIIIIKILRG